MNIALEKLNKKANAIRQTILNVAYQAPSDGVHISPALSLVDILTVLYGEVMRYSNDDITSLERDFFILSKGHAALGLYSTLYHFGIIDEPALNSFEINGSVLQVHPTLHPEYGIDFSSGSLAQGMSFAIGRALGQRMNKEQWHTYVLVGDGECNEGSIWEGAFMAAQYGLDNLTVLVDQNGLQSDGFTSDIMKMQLPSLWSSCGWEVFECDGHDFTALMDVLRKPVNGRPRVIIARTVKGKGVSFMENNKEFHRNRLNEEQMRVALNELNQEHSC
ncbi:transketolase [Candidatus Pantoea formicae]|jgi:transketolase|uniref:transketolase n=1 Tax=Candidatus Pantoea formicae TaxID=2608355 RepID=UPI003EDA5BB6